MTGLSFVVYGRPGPQGSKRALGPGRMIEQSPHVGPWREAVKAAARVAMRCDGWQMIPRGVPAALHLEIRHQRPASHYGTGRNADTLKPGAPVWKTTAPDLSKLIRSTEDALTDAGVWADDALVAWVTATDRWASGLTHAAITVHSPAQSCPTCPLNVDCPDRDDTATGVCFGPTSWHGTRIAWEIS